MFDHYHKWLGISPKDQPPNHYRLLGIELFEADPDVIDAAANKQMAYIQGCANGPHLPLSQKLLNEIAAARLCLLTPAKKAAYDAKLKASLPATPIPLATPTASQQGAMTEDFSASAASKNGSTPDSASRSDLAFQGLGASTKSPRSHRKKRPKHVLLGLATISFVIAGLVLVFTFGQSMFTADATKDKSVASEGKKKTSSQDKADIASTDGTKLKPDVPPKEITTAKAIVGVYGRVYFDDTNKPVPTADLEFMPDGKVLESGSHVAEWSVKENTVTIVITDEQFGTVQLKADGTNRLAGINTHKNGNQFKWVLTRKKTENQVP